MTARTNSIEVFGDIWCPFTHVGLRTIEDRRSRAGRTDVAIRVRAWPLELVNGRPLDPSVTKEHVDELLNAAAHSEQARTPARNPVMMQASHAAS